MDQVIGAIGPCPALLALCSGAPPGGVVVGFRAEVCLCPANASVSVPAAVPVWLLFPAATSSVSHGRGWGDFDILISDSFQVSEGSIGLDITVPVWGLPGWRGLGEACPQPHLHYGREEVRGARKEEKA